MGILYNRSWKKSGPGAYRIMSHWSLHFSKQKLWLVNKCVTWFEPEGHEWILISTSVKGFNVEAISCDDPIMWLHKMWLSETKQNSPGVRQATHLSSENAKFLLSNLSTWQLYCYAQCSLCEDVLMARQYFELNTNFSMLTCSKQQHKFII